MIRVTEIKVMIIITVRTKLIIFPWTLTKTG